MARTCGKCWRAACPRGIKSHDEGTKHADPTNTTAGTPPLPPSFPPSLPPSLPLSLPPSFPHRGPFPDGEDALEWEDGGHFLQEGDRFFLSHISLRRDGGEEGGEEGGEVRREGRKSRGRKSAIGLLLFPPRFHPPSLPPSLLSSPYLEEGGSVTLLEEGGRRSEGDEVGRREGGKGCPDLRYGPFGILKEEVGVVAAGEGGREGE